MNRVLEAIKGWWNGTTEVDSESYGVWIRTRFHWTARLSRAFFSFCRDHWQWLAMFLLGFVTLLLML